MRTRALLLFAIVVVFAGCTARPRGTVERDPSRTAAEIAQRPTLEVRGGDTWSSLSSRIYGDDRGAEAIAALNGYDPASMPPVGARVRVEIAAKDLDDVRAVAEARGSYNAGFEAMNERGRDAEARVAFERALDRAPHFLDARYNLGLVLIRLGEPEAALGHLRRVADARPDDRDALYGLAAAHVHRGDNRAALAPLERALALDPDFLQARFAYALALERVGRTEDAARAWQAYLDRDATSALADQAREHLRQLRPGR